MRQEDIKYYTFNDVVNTALQKANLNQNKKDLPGEAEFSLNVISDLTYSNIWNSFIKWCTDQTELGYLINIFSFGNMFYVSEKQNEGISVKMTDFFLREHNLRWNETKSTYEGLYRVKYENGQPQTEKLNYIAISTELNTKKILVQNGLNNLFNAVGYLLETTRNCLIDLGVLGQFICNNKLVYQVPSKLKNDSISNKKTTIKSLIDRTQKMQSKPEEEKLDNYDNLDDNEKETEEMKEKIEKNINEVEKDDKAKNLIGYENDGLTEQERLEIMNAKQVIKDTLKPNNLNKSSSEFKKMMHEGEEQKIHIDDEYYTDQIIASVNKKKITSSKS